MGTIPDKTIWTEAPDPLEETLSRVERPVLILLEGGGVERRRHIDKSEFVVGRDQTNEIVLRDSRCSRRHARLVYKNFDHPDQPPIVYIEDNNSTNGTFVNGVKIDRHLLQDRDRIVIGSTVFGFFLRDQAELEADQQLFHLASNDALTGLRNRGVFNLEMAKEFDRARRYGRDLSLVMFDIDHFKLFNDTYGHQCGDMVLQEMGRIVKANIRFNDLGARYGGEEFAIILPETGLDGALIQAERMRQAVASHNFTNQQSTSISLTISLGVAMMDDSMKSMDDLIKAADMGLYKAKQAGRNRVGWMRNGQLQVGEIVLNHTQERLARR